MSLYKDASLVMIPSAYKNGKLYSIRPTDGDGDFTFSRGSNLAATRVDVNGLIEKGRENLILQSNQFDTTWGTDSSTMTSGQSGYDGTSDAWLLSRTGAYGRFGQVISLNGLYTFSVYVKAGTKSFVRFGSSSGNVDAYFNLSNGEVTSSGALIIDAKTTDVGNGWYRCQMTFSATLSYLNVWVADSNGDVTGTTGTIYVQDAQLEQGLVATDYIETGASTAQAGILEDMPRLDYSGGASCPSLLLEPQRSNLFIQSEHLKDWTDNNIIRTANNSISPEGVQNATLISGDGTFGVHRFYQTPAYISGTSYTISIFAKAGTNDFFQIYLGNAFDNSAGQVYANFDLSDGSKGTAGSNVDDYDIEDYGNGWYRCYLTAESQLSGTTGTFYNLTTSDSVGRAASSALTTNVEFYGAQLEAGSYPTSYIPTYGSSVTRSGDAASLTSVADLLGDGNGTLFVEAETFEDNAHIVLSDGTLNNVFPFRFRLTNFQNDMKVDNVSQGNIVVSSTSTNTRYKVASRYSLNDRAVYFDGVLQDTDSNNEVFPEGTLTRIGLDRGDGLSNFYGRIYQLLVFPTALTNAELAALTA